MSVYEVKMKCPSCRTSEAVWAHNGTYFPSKMILCSKCHSIYDPHGNITDIELRSTIAEITQSCKI